MRISDLTKGEKLFLSRRRVKQTLMVAAKKYKTTVPQYLDWERDIEEAPEPLKKLGRLTLEDIFLVLRRRSEKTVAEIAEEVGCCPWWLRWMETGKANNEKLTAYWSI